MMLSSARVLVCGLGSIGRRHLRNLLAMGYRDVAVCRRTLSDAQATEKEFGIQAFANLAVAEAWHPNVVLVTNPTSEHIPVAAWALERNCHLFIEKPVSNSLEGVQALVDRAERKGLVLAIGHNLRFHPAMEAIKRAIAAGDIGRLLTARAEVGQYLPGWHPSEDYRQEYSARSCMGGGALLTLIHELDSVLWITGDVAECIGLRARVSDLEIDVDDVAEIICRHVSGALTSVHMDFLDRSYNRRSRWIGTSGTLEWTWHKELRLLAADGSSYVLWDNPEFDLNETYKSQLRDFFECIQYGTQPRTSGRDALQSLRLCQHVRWPRLSGHDECQVH